jgi:hypothetical protein
MNDPTFLGMPLSLYGVPCLLLAFAFMLIWPYKKAPQHGWRRYVLRWGHSLVWLLLGLAAFAGGTLGPNGAALARGLALGGLLIYIIFVVTLVTTKPEAERP